MNTNKKKMTRSDELTFNFLEEAKLLNADVELIKVLKSRTYRIGEANVLVRAASVANPKYFFGINYITLEEISNLDNPFIAFICGSLDRTVILPAQTIFSRINQISRDRNGELKINIDKDLNLVLSGRNQRLDCKSFVNSWDLLLNPPKIKSDRKSTVEESLHSVIQGRLIEIGNIRGLETYCPNKSKFFNGRKLEDLITLKNCPELQFSDYDLLRQIDVLWFKYSGENIIPQKAFEVELSTGVWSGVGRMSTLKDYSNVDFYVISWDKRKYNKVINSFPEQRERFRFVQNESLGQLYSAELNLKSLRVDIGL